MNSFFVVAFIILAIICVGVAFNTWTKNMIGWRESVKQTILLAIFCLVAAIAVKVIGP